MHAVTLASGRGIPELTLQYRTLGMPTHDETGLITNAARLLRGARSGAPDFLADDPADMFFASGQSLDASQYFLVFPDPIDALSGPGELVQVQYLLVLEHLGINHLGLIFGTMAAISYFGTIVRAPAQARARWCRSGKSDPACWSRRRVNDQRLRVRGAMFSILGTNQR